MRHRVIRALGIALGILAIPMMYVVVGGVLYITRSPYEGPLMTPAAAKLDILSDRLDAELAADRRKAKATVAVARKPAVMKWHNKCFPHFHFCASFPYVDGSEQAFKYIVYDLPLGSAANGKEPTFTSQVYRNTKTGQFCLSGDGTPCDGKNGRSDFYAVSVFRSKFSDTWTALTALNGGVKHPVRTTVQGNLAARFGSIYGPVELSIYHHGLVYYVVAGTFFSIHQEALYGKRFLSSIRFT
jgi:hypothetical protein